MFFASKTYKVICVGSTSKDIFFPTDEGTIIQTPEDLVSKVKIAFELGGKYRVADRYEAVGGVAANVSHGLTRLDHAAACYSKIGNDETGKWILHEFKSAGVPTEFLFVDTVVKTDLSAIIVLTQSGERTIFHNRDANEKLEISDEKFAGAGWVFVSALNGNWQENLKKILLLKEKYGFSLAFNPGQHNIKEDPGFLLEAIAVADVLLLNKDEAIELVMQTQKELPKERLDDEMYLLQTLGRVGAKIIGMTDGKRGAWSFDGQEYWYCPIHTRNSIVDSTGCGDAFGSGFFAAVLEGGSVERALRYGIANSGSVVGAYGATAGLLKTDEMKNIIEKITPERLN
ncbi:MAG: carbohydrate kinase family protein [Candidatus Moranbacteria bacterium]|nr:carbohydrate kinase family protein [Candidatus Moranbacteria bacterium]